MHNSLFIRILDDLKEDGISYSKIAKQLNIRVKTLYNIRQGLQKASSDLLIDLSNIYPQFKQEIQEHLDIDNFNNKSYELAQKALELAEKEIELLKMENRILRNELEKKETSNDQ